MTSAQIITGITYFIVASGMVTIGISQFTAKNPVTFYSGEKALPAEKLTSVEGWNRSHGRMWMIYGLCVLLSALPFMFSDGTAALIALCGGVVLPLPFMILYHHRLLKKYLKPEEDEIDSRTP